MFVDLSTSKFGLPYHIDLSLLTQTRIHTGRVRKIQRVFTKVSYPSENVQQTGTKRQMGAFASKTLSKQARLSAPSTSNPTNFANHTASGSSLTAMPSFSQGLFNPVSSQTATLGSSVTSNSAFVNMPLTQTLTHSQGPLTRRRFHQTLAGQAGSMGHSGSHLISGLSNHTFLPAHSGTSVNSQRSSTMQFGTGPGFHPGMIPNPMPNGSMGSMFAGPGFNFHQMSSATGGHVHGG